MTAAGTHAWLAHWAAVQKAGKHPLSFHKAMIQAENKLTPSADKPDKRLSTDASSGKPEKVKGKGASKVHKATSGGKKVNGASKHPRHYGAGAADGEDVAGGGNGGRDRNGEDGNESRRSDDGDNGNGDESGGQDGPDDDDDDKTGDDEDEGDREEDDESVVTVKVLPDAPASAGDTPQGRLAFLEALSPEIVYKRLLFLLEQCEVRTYMTLLSAD